MKRLLCAALFALAGCGLPGADTGSSIDNSCGGDSECGENGACLAGQCVAVSADLVGVQLQVDLTGTSDFAPGLSYLLDPSEEGVLLQGTRAPGYLVEHNLLLAAPVALTAAVFVEQTPVGCEALHGDDDSFAATFQLYPRAPAFGIPLPVHTVEATLIDDEAGRRFAATVAIAPGSYDVLVVPQPRYEMDELSVACELPPTLLLDRLLVNERETFTVSLGEPGTVAGQIDGLDLSEWTIELVDNINGRTISTRVTLTPQPAGEPYAFNLRAWTELLTDDAVAPILRLTPPPDATAMPIVLWKLESLNPLSPDFQNISLNVSPLDVEPIAVSGTMVGEDYEPVTGSLVFQSRELVDNGLGNNAVYISSIDTDSSGIFETSLLPGVYRALAVPLGSSTLATSQDTLTLATGSLGSGQTFRARSKSQLNGQALTPTGEPADQVSLLLEPTVVRPTEYFEHVIDAYTSQVLPPSVPVATLTSQTGAFSALVDPGALDLSLRPPETTGFPWLVRSRVGAPTQTDPTTLDLGPLAIPNPVVLRGAVLAPDGTPQAGALVRAWLPVESESEDERDTAVQLGEALTGSDGRYQLLLPPSISQ